MGRMEHHHLISGIFNAADFRAARQGDKATAESCKNIFGACHFQAVERGAQGFLGPPGSIFKYFQDEIPGTKN